MIRQGKLAYLLLSLFLTLIPFNGVKFAFASPGAPNSLRTGEILLRLKNNPQVYKVRADEKNLDRLVAEYRKSPLVELAEPNQLFKASLIPDDQFYTKQTYHNQVFSLDAWDKTQGSSSVVIAIIDSGVDIDHPDLINNIWKNVDEIAGDGLDNDNNGFVDDVNGWDFVTGTPDPNPKGDGFFQQPPEGQPSDGQAPQASVTAGNSTVRRSGGPIGLNHGTVVAGVASAKGNNREGIAGVSWNSQIMPVRILDSGGFGDTINVVKGIDYAVVNGAHIINLSFVGFDLSPLMDEAVLRAYNSNIIVVAAAGNDVLNSGANLDVTPGFPVCSGIENPNNILLGVSAVDSSDLKAKFSNYGARCVDIAAPGVNFFSSQAQLTQIGLFDLYGDNWSGTSMATPLISGAAALLKAVKPTLTNREIIDILLESSDSINEKNPDFVGKLGRGRLNIFRALLAVLPAGPIVPVVPTEPPALPPATPLTAPTEPASPVMLNLPTPTLQAKNLVTVPAGFLNSQVQIYDLESSVKVRSFRAFPFVFRGGLNLVVGDIQNDGFEEILVAPGEGGSPQVRIFDTRGVLRGQFFAGSSLLRGGATLALADIDGDGIKEIIVGLGKGAAPEVKIFKKNGVLVKEFFAYPKNFKGGVSVAVGDLDNDGQLEIVTASGPGVTASVKIFDSDGKLKSELIPFPNFLGGLTVAVADLGGDGFKEILVGPANVGGPQIKVFNSLNKLVSQFFAFDSVLRGGLSLAAGNLVADGGDEIIAAAGKNSEARVRVYDSRAQKTLDLLVYPITYKGGVRVGALLKIEN